MGKPMNETSGASYPLFGIGRVCFADEATRIPSVLMDDGYCSDEQHAAMLETLVEANPHLDIEPDGVWESMPWLDHTGEKHHYLNLIVKPRLAVGTRVGVYWISDGSLNKHNPVVTLVRQENGIFVTDQGGLLDAKTGVFCGNVFKAGLPPLGEA